MLTASPDSAWTRLVAAAKRDILEGTLSAHSWNVSAAARALGLHRCALHKLCRSVGVRFPAWHHKGRFGNEAWRSLR